jgi:hypothetical protein
MAATVNDITSLAEVCAATDPGHGPDALVSGLGGLWPHLAFRTVLTRGGWYRLGGVVDLEHRRVADSLRLWAEQQAGDDVARLLDVCARTPLFATRLNGGTHYLTAPTGEAATDFLQLEVEELREVLDRYLSDPDWLPDSIEEFIDPLDYPHLEPEAVAAPRFVFRRLVSARELLDSASGANATGLARFARDWECSSAGQTATLCKQWVFVVREFIDSDGDAQVSARPGPARSFKRLRPDAETRGADLANLVHDYDHVAGYPMAWYFHMVAAAGVSHTVGAQVAEDMQCGFSYLPERDLQVLHNWMDDPYRV